MPSSEARRGVGIFRFAGWGWGFTIALVLFVGAIVLVGYLRDDPGRNPAPAGYATAVCAAVEELSEGTRALERGVEAGDRPADADLGGDRGRRTRPRRERGAHRPAAVGARSFAR